MRQRKAKPLGKRELKYRENANEGFDISDERKEFANSQRSGIKSRVIDLIRRGQGFSGRRGEQSGPRRTMTPGYTGPDQHVEKGNIPHEDS